MRGKRFSMSFTLMLTFLFSIISFYECGLESASQSQEEELGIQPKSVTIDSSKVTDIVFNTWGGSGDYTWSISDDSLGTLVAGKSTAVYTSKTVVGQNTVAVTDGNSTASATVIQE
jgi:hypothetical protein